MPKIADRLAALPPYPFEDIDNKKSAAIAAGVDVVDLGVGDPDSPTLPHIIEALQQAATDPENHPYPPYRGSGPFRESCARYMKRRFGVELDPAGELLALIGSKEGIGHLALALLNPGDVALVPDPGYPVYAISAGFVGAESHAMPLLRENNFLPRLGDIPIEVAKRAKVIWVNYPNNPLGAEASRDFYLALADFAAEYDLVVAADAAYAEIYFGEPPLSALEIPALRERCIEFHSLSKTFNMTGWRVGFAAGTPWIVHALGSVKTNLDSGVFAAVQQAAIAALDGPWEPVRALCALYEKRRDALVASLRAAGYDCLEAPATFYVNVAVPAGETSVSFAGKLLDEAGIVCTPATAFGNAGEGYVRFSLTASDERIALAAERIAGLKTS